MTLAGRLGPAFVAGALGVSASAQTVPIVDFDGSSGVGLFESFTTDATETPGSLVIDTTGFGGFSVGLTPTVVDSDALQLRVRARRLPGNVAENFTVSLTDVDSATSADAFQWRVSTEDLSETGFTDIVFSLGSTPLGVVTAPGFANPGDGEANFGLEFFILQSDFNVRDRLAIEIAEIVLEPVCLTADYVVADLGTGFIGGGFGGFSNTTNPGALTETNNSVVINVSSFGGSGRAFAASTEIPAERYQVRITGRRLPGNTQDNFQLVFGDIDGDDSAPGLGGENYEYNFLTANFAEGVYTDVSIPLSAFSRLGPSFATANTGDGELNPGFFEWFIQSPFGETDTLNLEIKDIVIEAIPGAPAIPLATFDENAPTLPGLFTFGAFGTGGALTANPEGLLIDVSDFGGIGFNSGPILEFDAASTVIEIVARARVGNQSTGFTIGLTDNDSVGADPLESGEEFQFFFSTQGFGADGTGAVATDGAFFTVTQPLTNPGPVFRQQAFNFLTDGNMTQDFGLDQWQITSQFGSTARLLIEIASVRLVAVSPSFIDPDLDGDGARTFFDMLSFLDAPFDLTNEGVTDFEDALFFVNLLKCACPE